MAAYVVNEIWVTEAERFQTYVVQVPPTLAPFGGRCRVRSGASEAIEGEPPGRLVILEFPDRETAKGLARLAGVPGHPPDPRRFFDVAGLCGRRARAGLTPRYFARPSSVQSSCLARWCWRTAGPSAPNSMEDSVAAVNFGQAGPPAAPGLPDLMKAAQ